MLRPVGGRPLLVAALEAGGVVLRFIAKELVKPVQPRRSVHQPIPVVMADFMAKMPQQRAVRLAHGFAHGFALGVIGLFEVDGDQAGVVAGHDMRLIAAGAQKVEHQAALGVFVDAGGHRQPEQDQRRHHAALGHLDAPPQLAVVGLVGVVEVGRGVVQAAGRAQRLRVIGGQQPVAQRGRGDIQAALVNRRLGRRVFGQRPRLNDSQRLSGRQPFGRTRAPRATRLDGRCGPRQPGVGLRPRNQRQQNAARRVVAQRGVAGQALAVAEKYRLTAVAAVMAGHQNRRRFDGLGRWGNKL